ncbi:hypothetical protein Sipo7851_40850 [Streptomyces ipomoeae]|nr:hypothetical protein Sipo7851_40850 [Streptomyces ipomoeae]
MPGGEPRRDTAAVLLTWIAEIADEPLLLEPNDRVAEQRTNTWCLSAEPEDRTRLSVSEVAAALEHTAAAIQARVHDSGYSGHATFYVWYDAQAGQLRCSTGSVGTDELPFGGVHMPVHDLRPVVEAFLNDAAPDVNAWSGLEEPGNDEEVEDSAESETEPPPFPVWVRRVGGVAA